MNSTNNGTLLSLLNGSLLLTPNCSLPNRVYSKTYLSFKLLNATYIRLLIGPGILLNILCLIVLSRPRLSNKSTTIVFLRFLAVFDILAITLKYVRAEINYQSTEKDHQILLLTPAICKALYVLMNASISISMWIIVLMSLDKVVAVTYPLQSSIWITQKRVFYICCCTIIILSSANLSFINFSGILRTRFKRIYCGLDVESVIVDLLTASILPMGIITTANIVIAVVLHRVARVSLDWSASGDRNVPRNSDMNALKHHSSAPSFRYRTSASSTPTTLDILLATKRRTSTQVTRMLLAVTLSLIICNIPNTIFFFLIKIRDTRQLLSGRLCTDISDHDITLYKLTFYSSVMQDILSDLPHIFNFFLYCLAGKKFRSIFISEVQNFLLELHLIKHKPACFKKGNYAFNPELTAATSINARRKNASAKQRLTVDVLYNGKTNTTVLTHNKKFNLGKRTNVNLTDQSSIHSYQSIR